MFSLQKASAFGEVGSLRRRAAYLTPLTAIFSLLLFLVSVIPPHLAAAPLSAEPPTLATVSPAEAYNYQVTTITITGSGFVATPSVTLGNVSLTEITWVSSTTLTALVPAGLPGGAHTLTVSNPDNQSASLSTAFTVLPSGDGSLGPWQSTSPVIRARQRPAAVVAHGYMYVLGGYVGVAVADVERAVINPDGSLGPWQATRPLSTPRNGPSAVAANGYLYVLGGCCYGDSVSIQVERAAIGADGMLGPWEAMPSLLTSIGPNSVAMSGDYLYAVSPHHWYDTMSESQWTHIGSDGSLSPWQKGPPLTLRRHEHAVVAAGGFLYTVGGNIEFQTDEDYYRSVERAPIEPDGSLGPWQLTTPMNTLRRHHAAVAVGGFLYALGGYASSGYNNIVERASVNPDGSLEPWEVISTVARSNAPAVTARNFLYVIAGESDHQTVARVDRAALSPIRIDALTPSAVAPDRARTITLTGSNFLPLSTLRLGEGLTLPTTVTSANALTATVPAGLADGWYTATLTNPDGRVTPRTQALQVDGTSPTGSVVINNGAEYAASRSVTLTLAGSDGGSGLAEMAFSNDGLAFSAFEPYSSTKQWTLPAGDGPKTVFARLRDRAGNVSATLTDTISLNQAGPTGSLLINGGALNTAAETVTLTLSATAATTASEVAAMGFSNDGNAWSAWRSYATSASWTLTSGDSTKTVYGRFRDTAGNISSVVSGTIRLDTEAGAEYALSINQGALFTNQTGVRLTIGARAYTAQMQVSNDGGFAGVAWEPYATQKAWEVTAYQSYVLPRVVYVRFKDVGGTVSPTYQDDIILDVTAPTGSVSIVDSSSGASTLRVLANSVTLSLQATDDRSGVDSMRLSNQPNFAGASWQPYATSQSWTLGTTNMVYVQFRDKAGNVSEIYSPVVGGSRSAVYFPSLSRSR